MVGGIASGDNPGSGRADAAGKVGNAGGWIDAYNIRVADVEGRK